MQTQGQTAHKSEVIDKLVKMETDKQTKIMKIRKQICKQKMYQDKVKNVL